MSRTAAESVLAEAEDACTDCRACIQRCGSPYREGLTIGAIAGRVLADREDDEVRLAVHTCAICGLCCVGCPAALDAAKVMSAAREVLEARGRGMALSRSDLLLDDDLTVLADYKSRHGIDYGDLRARECDTVFFPGCSLAAYSPELVREVHRWLGERLGRVSVLDSCCGAPLTLAGFSGESAALRSRLSQQAVSAGATRLVVACPSCLHELDGRVGDLEVRSLTTVLRAHGAKVACGSSVTIHDSCADRHAQIAGGDLRAILSPSHLVEMEHSGKETLCCGSGGLVSRVAPDLCDARARARVAESRRAGAGHMVTACGHCSQRLAGVADRGEVFHYLELVFDHRIDWTEVSRRLERLRGEVAGS